MKSRIVIASVARKSGYQKIREIYSSDQTVRGLHEFRLYVPSCDLECITISCVNCGIQRLQMTYCLDETIINICLNKPYT
jgi:hypothetical protein